MGTYVICPCVIDLFHLISESYSLSLKWKNFKVLLYYTVCIIQRISSLFKAEKYSVACTNYILLICSFIDEFWGCFHPLAIVNNARNMGVPLWVPAFNSFEYKPKGGIANINILWFLLLIDWVFPALCLWISRFYPLVKDFPIELLSLQMVLIISTCWDN